MTKSGTNRQTSGIQTKGELDNTAFDKERPIRIEDVAVYLGISKKTVQRQIQNGKLIAFKIGGRWFTQMACIQAYIQQQLADTQGRQLC